MTRIPTATTFHLCREVQAHIDWLMDKYDDKFFIDLEFVKNQYRWFDGVPVSVDHVSVDNVSEGPRFLFDPTNGEIESTDCSVTQSELPCQKPDSMFCTIEENTYQGMNVTNDGKECIPWQDVAAEYHDMSQWTLEQQIIKGFTKETFVEIHVIAQVQLKCNNGWDQKFIPYFETLRSNSCDEPDDCASGNHGCHSDATCVTKKATYGSKVSGYTCICNDGFYGNGKECYPEVNERDDGPHRCHEFAQCVDKSAGYD